MEAALAHLAVLPTVLAGEHAPGQRVVGHEGDVVGAEDGQELAFHPAVDGVVEALVDLGQGIRLVLADLGWEKYELFSGRCISTITRWGW